MEVFLMKAAQLVAALAFLVIIHEFGHYIIARRNSICSSTRGSHS